MSKTKEKSPSETSSDPKGSDKPTVTRRGISFSQDIDIFVYHIDGLARAYIQTMKVVTDSMKKCAGGFQEFLAEKGIETTDKDGKSSYQLKPQDLRLLQKQLKELSASSVAMKKVPEIFFCALFHQYDAYLGNLLRASFYVKPELLNASQKQLTFAELLTFDTMDSAREYLVEKEIETIIRDSHDDRFNWMENHFGLPLKKDLSIWSTFIEMTERRHLFVHCDGFVSSQYLAICKKHGVNFEKELSAGQSTGVTEKYFEQSVGCILEIGVKLGHVLWRKLQPSELEKADNALHKTTYDLLVDERYALAKVLLTFAVKTLKKHSSEEIRRIHLVNLAIAHYYLREKQEATDILDKEDWSACKDKFKLAAAVLHNDYADAVKLMRKIGKQGEVTREDYSSYPLFREFRQTKEFLGTYKKLFGKEFIVSQEKHEEDMEDKNISQKVVLPDR